MKQFYRVQAVAKTMGVSSQTIRNRIESNEIRAQKFGRLYLIPVEEVARLLGKSIEEASRLVEENEWLTRQLTAV